MAISKREAWRRLRVPAVIVVCVMAARLWVDYSDEGRFTAASIASVALTLLIIAGIFLTIVWVLTKPKA